MRVDFLAQAGKLLKEQKQYRYRLVVFLCLAVIVTFGTVTALKLYGQAMTHKMEVLDCQYEVHEHTEECYERDENGNPGTEVICGYADYAIHVHNDRCYGTDGSLVCALEEHKVHEHTEECLVTENVLICGENTEGTGDTEAAGDTEEIGDSEGTENGNSVPAETAPEDETVPSEDGNNIPDGMESSDEDEVSDAADPVAEAQPELVCGTEVHRHTESCYEDTVTCGYAEEHVHDETCLNRTLECAGEEHIHGEGCYDGEGNITCTLEEHTHQIGCFDSNGSQICGKELHTHDVNCQDGEETLICGAEEHGEHFGGCYRQEYVCGKELHTHEESCHGQSLICGTEEHEHTEGCYTLPQEEEGQPEAQEESPAESGETTEDAAANGEAEGLESAEGSTAVPESPQGHMHTDACYEEVVALICGERELHTHDDSCYGEDCFDEDGNLIAGSQVSCGLLQLEEHVHEGNCFKTVELTPEEVAALNNGAKLHIHEDGCYDGEGKLICGHEATHIHVLECYDDAGNLICGYGTASHVHEEKCYDAAGGLICGYETASHVHQDSCYDAEGNQHCGYETAVHGHETECYDKEGNLICGYETAKHPHETGCYDEKGNVICGYDTASHLHVEGCHDEEGNLICGYETEKHIHEESCYDAEGNLICGYEDEREHEHDSRCYDEEGNLTCGKEYARDHEHAAHCYQEGSLICGYEGVREHEHDGKCRDEEGSLICGYEGVREHEHDGKCRDEEGSLICGYEDCRVHEHAAECYDIYDELACGYEDAEDHVHTEDCYDGNGNLACGYEILEEYSNSKIFRGSSYTVVAKYHDDADLPEEARLLVEEITADSDKEHYERRETEYQEMMDNEGASMRALLKIGFYVEREEGLTEVEPAAPVLVSVQFLDEDGLPEGSPVTVVHFAEDGTEMLDGGSAVDNSTTFKIGSFSEIAIGYIEEEDPRAVKEKEDGTMRLHLSDSFEYRDKAFQMIFHVEGEAILPEGTEVENPSKKNCSSEELEEDAETEEAESVEEDLAGEESEEDETAFESEDGYIDIRKLKFKVEQMSSESEEYKAFLEHALSGTGIDELYRMQVLTYSLTYGEEELDLSECKVTVEIRPAQELQEAMGQSVTDGVTYLMNTDGEAILDEAEVIPDAGPYRVETPREEGEGAEETEELTLGEEEAQEEESTPAETFQPSQSSASESNGLDSTAGNGVDAISLTVMAMAEDGPTDLDQADFDGEGDVLLEADLTGIEVFAAQAAGYPNPHFTVQYYADLEKVAYNDNGLIENIDGKNTNELLVIDTDGGKLPGNGKGADKSPNGNEIRRLYVDTKTGKLKTKRELTKVYEERSYEYHKAPTINYINALIENISYELKAVWVLKEGKNPESINEEHWTIYPYTEELHFTNREVSASETYVYIKDNAVLRLVYDTTSKEKDFEVAFYDYDIGDGKIYSSFEKAQSGSGGSPTSDQGTGTWYMKTGQQGINSPGNYTGSGTKLAFGNSNSGSGLQHEQWSGNLLNKNNSAQNGHPAVAGSYKGCTFGLAAGLEGGKIRYADGVIAPNLFHEGAAIGKTAYDENQYSLKFNRVGDTHTLTAVNGAGTSNLDSFNHPSPNDNTVHNHIWTNNFWPMDSAGSYGTDGHDMKFGNYGRREKYKFAGQAGSSGGSAVATGDFPWSDDGQDHNSYFGMHYKVEFDLVADYAGPLEYYFFGDDDMWVFLGDGDGNGELVCDIGGVHSSVGEYLNLWDYIDKEEEGIHRHEETCFGNGADNPPTCGYVDSKKFTLNFFYTERGESGSTCWMQFTLPSVSSLTPEKTDSDYGHLRVEKEVKIIANESEYEPEDFFDKGTEQAEYFEKKEFRFRLTLTGPSGPLKDDYAYVKYDRNGDIVSEGGGILAWNTIADGEEFTLKDGEYIKIQYLPVGSQYTLTELDDTGIEGVVYKGTVVEQDYSKLPEESGQEVSGTVPENQTSEVKYTNKYSVYALPETGGSGKALYTMAGALVLMAGAGFLYNKKCRERRAQDSL